MFAPADCPADNHACQRTVFIRDVVAHQKKITDKINETDLISHRSSDHKAADNEFFETD